MEKAKYELNVYKNGELVKTYRANVIPWKLTKFCLKLMNGKDEELAKKYAEHEEDIIEDIILGMFPEMKKSDFDELQVDGTQMANIVNEILAITKDGFSDNSDGESEKN